MRMVFDLDPTSLELLQDFKVLWFILGQFEVFPQRVINLQICVFVEKFFGKLPLQLFK